MFNLLRRSPFVPLEGTSFKDLTFDTLFLVLLASTSRVSSVHALGVCPPDVAFNRDHSQCSFNLLPEFPVLTQAVHLASKPMVFPALVIILAPDVAHHGCSRVASCNLFLAPLPARLGLLQLGVCPLHLGYCGSWTGCEL